MRDSMYEDGCCRFAGIERGTITGKMAGPLYRVDSLTREGVCSRWIPAIPQANNQEYAVGDRAYFFIFDDGRGMIVGPLTD